VKEDTEIDLELLEDEEVLSPLEKELQLTEQIRYVRITEFLKKKRKKKAFAGSNWWVCFKAFAV
jgi:hypothetical protein